MRCKTCDYPLWNLKTRQCPECGAAFKPSDYQFTMFAVKFCCPHCDQAYYGNGPHGYLRPSEFTCIKCAIFINMDSTVLRPSEGTDESHTRGNRAQWIEPSKGRQIRCFSSTIGESMLRPDRLIEGIPPESSMRRAAWFSDFTFSRHERLPALRRCSAVACSRACPIPTPPVS